MNAAEISAAAALIGVALGQLLARSGSYRKWLRAERHKAAAELLAAGEAIRKHSAGRILDAYAGTVSGDPARQHLADLERLDLALEAARTVFPAPVAAMAEQVADSARELAYGLKHASAATSSPGDRYYAARSRFSDAARCLIAPTLGGRLRSLRGARISPLAQAGRPRARVEPGV